MKLIWKITLILTATIIGYMLLLYLTVGSILMGGFKTWEEREVRHNLERVSNSLAKEIAEVSAITNDWSCWDESYRFVQDHNRKFVRNNLGANSYVRFGWDMILYLDDSRRLVYGKVLDKRTKSLEPAPRSVIDYIKRHPSLCRHTGRIEKSAGIIVLPEGPMMVSLRSVTSSDGNSPPHGALLIARHVRTDRICKDSRVKGAIIKLYLPDGKHIQNGTTVRPLSDGRIAGSAVISDIAGKPALMMRVTMPRGIYAQGQKDMLCFIVSLLFGGVIFGIVLLLLIEKLVLSRLKRLNTEVGRIDSDAQTEMRISTDGNDEISSLSGAVNDMLARIEQSQHDLKKSRERYRAFIEQGAEGIWRVEIDPPIPTDLPEDEQIRRMTEDGYLAECNDTFARMAGFGASDEIIGMKFIRWCFDMLPETPLMLYSFVWGGYVLEDYECRLADPEGNNHFYLNNVVGTVEDGHLVRVWSNVRDVTRRKTAERKLQIQTSAIQSTTDQIVITDTSGNVEYVNPAFERITGYSQEEVLGRSYEFLYPEELNGRPYEEIVHTISHGKTWQGEIIHRCQNGNLHISDTTVAPVFNDMGVIEHYVSINRDITEKKAYEQKLDHQAHHDSLTGLPNRLLFSDRLTQNLAQARRNEQSLAVMFLDLDRFKLINDTLGHKCGDELLRGVAARLEGVLRDVDTIARMGGDEFTIILGNVMSPNDSCLVAEKILHSFKEPFVIDGHELFVNASIGISLYPSDGGDVESLVKNADTAMYRAKEFGGNRYHLYTESLNAAVMERLTLEKSLRKAIEQDEFIVHYQPRVNLTSGRIMGMEALVRWQHPEMGIVPPSQFIPLAEETGLIVPLTEWVLDSACRQNKEWREMGYPALDVAVNISARHFQHRDLVTTVKKILDKTGLDPTSLDLELTESCLMQSPEAAIESLEDLKAMGVKISVDDFGTGYSSLSYLKKFPINTVKIDQSFVRDITTDPDDAAIAGAVVAMAHSLSLKVVAEGVETLGQLEFLRSLKCDEMQGYFVSRPVPAEEFARLLGKPLRASGHKWAA